MKINWKEVTRQIMAGLDNSYRFKIVFSQAEEGVWVPRGIFVAQKGLTLKELRRWLWEQRKCRFLEEKGVSLWAVKDDDGTVYVGFAQQVSGRVAERWIRMGGPTL